MKVAILAGGAGTRLAEETTVKPKPMVEIGGRPILWHIMKHYSHYGFDQFVIALGYKGEYIKKYVIDYSSLHSNLTVKIKNGDVRTHGVDHHPDWTVDLIDTGQTTLTGGRIKRIEPYIDGETFMVTYGDGVADIDISRLLARHREMGKLATVTGVRPMTRFGELEVADGLVAEFREKPQVKTGLINGGFFVFQREVFDYLTGDCSLEKEPLERLARDGQLAIYPHEGFWHCMDTYRDMESLNGLWASGKAPWKRSGDGE